jgi:hypothetical protein
VLIEHTEEAIVGGRFPVVIPFLGVTSYLIGVVKMESEERINDLSGRSKRKIRNDLCEWQQNQTLNGEAALASRKNATS